MPTPDQYRAKAAEFTQLARAGKTPDEVREFQNQERTLTVLADNEQWLADNHDRAVHASEGEGEEVYAAEKLGVSRGAKEVVGLERPGVGGRIQIEDEHILQCLGAALIMQWNTLPTKLQRELFDNAGAMGELLDTAALRGQIARFLHKHKDGGAAVDRPLAASD
jgi:hypothetical protein